MRKRGAVIRNLVVGQQRTADLFDLRDNRLRLCGGSSGRNLGAGILHPVSQTANGFGMTGWASVRSAPARTESWFRQVVSARNDVFAVALGVAIGHLHGIARCISIWRGRPACVKQFVAHFQPEKAAGHGQHIRKKVDLPAKAVLSNIRVRDAVCLPPMCFPIRICQDLAVAIGLALRNGAGC